MKTFEEIIKQKPKYINDWKDSGRIGLIGDFEDIYIDQKEYEAETAPYANEEYWIEKKEQMKIVLEKWKNVNILFASYGCANYSGDAWVLFEQEGRLYEVNGGHCSCYGLEGQWSPEEVDLKELENRLVNGTFGEDDWSDNNFKQALCEFLGVEFKYNTKKYY